MSDEMNVAGMDPEGFSSGLKDDFRARVVGTSYVPWDYEGKTDDDGRPLVRLGARFELDLLDDDGEPTGEEHYIQTWSAGDIDAFVPSEDGSTPAGTGTDPRDEEEEAQFAMDVGGQFALRVGRRTALSRNSGWARVIMSILEAGEASKHFGREDLATPAPGSIRCFEGLDLQFNRVPQERRSGLNEDSGQRREVLIATEVFGYEAPTATPAKAAKKVKKAKAAPAAADEDDGEDLDDTVQTLIIEALSEEESGELPKGRLASVLKSVDKTQKAAALKMVMSQQWLTDHSFTAVKGKVSLA